jgi:hypothetical protein
VLFLSHRPEQQYSFEKRTPIIIYDFVLFTTLKEQLTFTPQIYKFTNAEQFKTASLKKLLCAVNNL